eukprot:GHVT01067756.1.p1 GENE.GHVT01067756.1~~GHVT01067756.1.p1  ORF type:complete len:202 (+),score=22.98 GHVT01067756.1:1174-1779(+)
MNRQLHSDSYDPGENSQRLSSLVTPATSAALNRATSCPHRHGKDERSGSTADAVGSGSVTAQRKPEVLELQAKVRALVTRKNHLETLVKHHENRLKELQDDLDASSNSAQEQGRMVRQLRSSLSRKKEMVDMLRCRVKELEQPGCAVAKHDVVRLPVKASEKNCKNKRENRVQKDEEYEDEYEVAFAVQTVDEAPWADLVP